MENLKKMNALRQMRKRTSFTQVELAKAVGVTQETISLWELGKREMPVRHAKKIAEALRCDWQDLYDE